MQIAVHSTADMYSYLLFKFTKGQFYQIQGSRHDSGVSFTPSDQLSLSPPRHELRALSPLSGYGSSVQGKA